MNNNFNNFPYIYHTKGSASNRVPRVTIVGVVGDKTLDIAASRCSKNDQFCKKQGRDIAINRLKEGQFIAQIPIEEVGTNLTLHNFVDCAKLAADTVLKSGVHQKLAIVLVPQPMKAVCEIL